MLAREEYRLRAFGPKLRRRYAESVMALAACIARMLDAKSARHEAFYLWPLLKMQSHSP